MVPRIRPPPRTSVTTAVSLASYVFKNDLPGTRQQSTAQPRRWMVIRWGEDFPVRMVVFADSFFLLSVHSVSPPGHHASKQHTDRDKNGGVLGVLFFFSLSVLGSSEHYGFGVKGGIKGNRGGSIWLSAGFVGFGCCHESMFDTKNLYFYRALLLDWLVGWGKGTVLNQGLGKGEGGGAYLAMGLVHEERRGGSGHVCMYENQGKRGNGGRRTNGGNSDIKRNKKILKMYLYRSISFGGCCLTC